MKSVCAFGDSVLKGVVLDQISGKYKVLKNNFANICETTFGIQVDNWSKYGSTITNGENSLEKYYEKIKGHDYAILEFGGNDCDFNWKKISENPQESYSPNSSLEEFEKKYTKLIMEVKKCEVQPVLLSLPPINAQKYFNRISKGLNHENILKWMSNDKEFISRWHEIYNIKIFQIAMKNEIKVIDITTPFLKQKDYQTYICEDGIHPNEKGHHKIAEAINQYIVERYDSIDKWICFEQN